MWSLYRFKSDPIGLFSFRQNYVTDKLTWSCIDNFGLVLIICIKIACRFCKFTIFLENWKIYTFYPYLNRYNQLFFFLFQMRKNSLKGNTFRIIGCAIINDKRLLQKWKIWYQEKLSFLHVFVFTLYSSLSAFLSGTLQKVFWCNVRQCGSNLQLMVLWLPCTIKIVWYIVIYL